MSRDERRTCPSRDTPVTATKQPSGMLHVDVAQVVLARALDRRATRRRADAAARAPGSTCLPARYWPVIDSLTLRMPLTGPL